MGTGMNTEGFSEEVSLERALKDDRRRERKEGIIGHLEKQPEQRPGPGGNVGRQDQARP